MQGDEPVVEAPVGIGGPVSSPWREELLTRAQELRGLRGWLDGHGGNDQRTTKLLDAIDKHLDAVRDTAAGKQAWPRQLLRDVTGASFERTLGNLDAVEVDLLRISPSSVLIPALPSLVAHIHRYLPKDDPRRQAVDRIARDRLEQLPQKPATRLRRARPDVLSGDEREVLLSAQHAANSQRRRDLIRLRTFRNLLCGGLVVFLAIAITLGWIGWKSPTTIPLCFTPESDGKVKVVCPRQEEPIQGAATAGRDLDPAIARTVTKDDVWLVELLGLLGAALTGAAALRGLASNSTPHAVPVTLALFKLPTGAVTAVIGLVLMRADFVPGLSALDTSAQILGWAVIFGIAQQLVTQFADSQASGLLENIKGRGAGGDRELKG